MAEAEPRRKAVACPSQLAKRRPSWAGWALSVYSPGTRLPQMDTDTLLALPFPMLGIGAYRTIEKVKGVTK
ncbi:hypothetical protein [Azospirillum canadense]|uniref:hypothetical protein n=1 Tax=Azospirillum canadense TaxID=403962 RepID=UPI002227FDBC|nr:hypothetical protein [Azospirillum canadense]MCW2243560.1 hypothetical protein [Azospirillum canadense]